MLCAQAGLHITKMDVTLLFVTFVASFQMTFAELNVTVSPPEKTILQGDTLTVMCRINTSISNCAWDLLKSNKFLDVNPKSNLSEGIMYRGRGLEHGECGFVMLNVTKKHYRPFSCRLTLNNSEILNGTVFVVVAKSTSLKVTKSFEENKPILAECKITRVRSDVNISWYIGAKLIRDGVGPLQEKNEDPKGFKTVSRTLERNLTHLDDGKNLMCVFHQKRSGRGKNVLRRTTRLTVYFRPKLIKIKQNHFMINQPGEIVITTFANPKPETVWRADGEKEKYLTHHLSQKRKHIWEAMLQVDHVSPEILKNNYTFTAKNIAGEIQISAPLQVCHVPSDDLTVCFPLDHNLAALGLEEGVEMTTQTCKYEGATTEATAKL